jgi:hypothetical protein
MRVCCAQLIVLLFNVILSAVTSSLTTNYVFTQFLNMEFDLACRFHI